MTGTPDDGQPGSTGDRIDADAVLEIVRVGAEYVITGAIGGIVGDPAQRVFRRLVRRVKVRLPRPDEPVPRGLTGPEAEEWAVWLVERRYLAIITAAGRTPTYRVHHCRRSGDGRRWSVEVEYVGAGTFEVDLGDGDPGPIGDATVRWHPPSGAVAIPASDADTSAGSDDVVSRRVDGLRARIAFALPRRRPRR